MMESTKKFAVEEKDLLCKLVQTHKCLENKRSDVTSVTAKKKAWEAVAMEFNAQEFVQKRTSLQLRKCWDNMKMRRRKELAAESRYRMGTGGGPSISCKPAVPALDAAVPHLTENLGFLWDSDAVAVEEAAAASAATSAAAAAPAAANITVPEEIAVVAVPHDPAPATSTAPVPQTSVQEDPASDNSCEDVAPSFHPQYSSTAVNSSNSRSSITKSSLSRTAVVERELDFRTSSFARKEEREQQIHKERLAEAVFLRQKAEEECSRKQELHDLEIRTKEDHRRQDMRHKEELHRQLLKNQDELHRQAVRHQEELHLARLRSLHE